MSLTLRSASQRDEEHHLKVIHPIKYHRFEEEEEDCEQRSCRINSTHFIPKHSSVPSHIHVTKNPRSPKRTRQGHRGRIQHKILATMVVQELTSNPWIAGLFLLLSVLLPLGVDVVCVSRKRPPHQALLLANPSTLLIHFLETVLFYTLSSNALYQIQE